MEVPSCDGATTITGKSIRHEVPRISGYIDISGGLVKESQTITRSPYMVGTLALKAL